MRRRPRKRALGAATALLAAVAFVTAASAHISREERRLTVSSHGLFEKATLGTFCEAHGNHGVCADAGYPLETRGRLPVHPRGHVGLRTSAPAERVSVSFVRVRDDGHFRFVGPTKRARMHDDTGRRWRLRLPRDLPRRANILDAFIRYPDGDGDFWAGIRVHGRHR
jgi:hypothetical protein